MEPSSPLWNKINRFLDTHTFDLEWTPPGADESFKFHTKFKMELTGKKIYRQISDKEYVEYRLYILPSGGGSDIYFSTIKDLAGERTLTAESGSYFITLFFSKYFSPHLSKFVSQPKLNQLQVIFR
jgi:hypothetical protein